MYPSFLFLLILSRSTSALSSKSGSWHPFPALEPGQHKCIIKNTTDSFIMLTQSANYWRESNESYPRSELWTNYTLSGCDFISPHHTSANKPSLFLLQLVAVVNPIKPIKEHTCPQSPAAETEKSREREQACQSHKAGPRKERHKKWMPLMFILFWKLISVFLGNN